MPNNVVLRPPFRKRGQGWMPFSKLLNLGSFTGSGGVLIGGGVDTVFTHGNPVTSRIVVEWDFDNDGDFSDPEEDITDAVLSLSTTTGRDWPSLLTGKAGPGLLRATLSNTDDRFSYFNSGSPLTAAPNSLKTGRRLRVRTVESVPDDPALLAKDRFGRVDGALGTPEVGAAWSGPLANDFTIVSKKAKAATAGQPHIATIDVGVVDYYAQARFTEVGGRDNVVGLVYRYQDSTNYSLAVLDVAAAQFKLINVVAGVSTTIQSTATEVYDDVTIGVLLASTSVTMYHEGVPVLTGTAIQTDETEVGFYGSYGTNDLAPEVDDFYTWDGLPAEVEGILWTGDVSDLSTAVQPGPQKTASLKGEGFLSRLAGQRLTAVRAVQGAQTGVLVGNVLARSNLLHPPGSIDAGDVTTGPVAFAELDALEAARRFEEAEFGFLYESQEGPLNFESRTARDSRTTQALFSDDPDDQYHYSGIEPLDWRKEVVNRVFAGVTPSAPSGITRTATTGSIAEDTLDVTMPASVAAGDLLVVAIAVSSNDPTTPFYSEDIWGEPVGWKELTGKAKTYDAVLSTDPARIPTDGFRVFVKVADGTEDSTVVPFFAAGGDAVVSLSYRYYAVHLYQVTNWYGSLDGVVLSDVSATSDPSVVFPAWGPSASLLIAMRAGTGGATNTGTTVSGTLYPLGYGNGASTTSENLGAQASATLESAYRLAAVEVENPGTFSGTFTGYPYIDSRVLAIRGYNGSPPMGNGIVEVQLDDLDSQDDHNSIRTYNDPADLFADTAQATVYAQLVLDRYADDRPLISLEFYPVKSGNYRYQALKRRVGDRITLVAQNNAGLGISADFYIETITHEWSHGITYWSTSWALSPV